MFSWRLQFAGSSINKCKQNEAFFIFFISNKHLSVMTDCLIQNVNLLVEGAISRIGSLEPDSSDAAVWYSRTHGSTKEPEVVSLLQYTPTNTQDFRLWCFRTTLYHEKLWSCSGIMFWRRFSFPKLQLDPLFLIHSCVTSCSCQEKPLNSFISSWLCLATTELPRGNISHGLLISL